MKIIQSLWSKPSESQDTDMFGRAVGGFMDSRFHYMSWALSCLTFKKYYKTIELVTDEIGYKMLIDELHLPYSKVTVCLDELNNYHPKLWALGKIKAYQLQKEPFLHVDGDVFIWKQLGSKLFHKQNLIVQNMEDNYEFYDDILKSIHECFSYIPECVKTQYRICNNLSSINAGIIGGSDIDFFQNYTREVFKFVDNNIDYFDNINIGMFNCVYEQYLFCSLAKSLNKPIKPFVKLDPKKEFTEVMRFDLIPFERAYIHLMGLSKRNIFGCEQVEMRLKYEFPQYYETICDRFDNSYFSKSDDRFEKLKTVYNFFKQTSIDDFLMTPLRLSSHVKIMENLEINTLSFTSPQTSKQVEIQLEGWNTALAAFKEPTSGNELLSILTENVNLNKKDMLSLKLEIVGFLSDHLTYKDILSLA